jgi:hypothetical protein
MDVYTENGWERSAARLSPWALFTAAALATLFAYLVAREAIDPGFTDYWGFMLVQIAGTLAVVVALTIWLAPQGGLSWYTHLVVTVNTWADTLGTAGHLYERHAMYDKVTHFLAGVALTAAAADILRALDERGVIRLGLAWRLQLAMTLTLLLNLGWEGYEYLGDVVFASERHRGTLDTGYDLVSDMAGALVSALVISVSSTRRADLRAADASGASSAA